MPVTIELSKQSMKIIFNPIHTNAFIHIGDRERNLVIIVTIGVVRVIL